ncbi:SusC/RagA family TonB-linked outer membrane protein [Persicobacter diffluens]|uniref:SusC/RagA family TonB-linked outer membrane protein n=2 Tax=Persicobacter diffluens TaxID=981 RepID=A0AAN4W251_9BACT|nr:SusC/RagA family TonB-linked outer membrane protein [Persicobacter diffluens]
MAQHQVKGTVTDATDGSGIPGANIIVVGDEGTGTVSDFEGHYTLTVAEDAELQFSFIGYNPQTIAVNGEAVINAALSYDLVELDDVVVTAFGLKKEKKALAYAVAEVEGSDLAVSRTGSAASALSGRVAGVEVGGNSPGQASRVTIRGNTSISGNNQPLYVVDGVPLDNTNVSSADRWGGVDLGDGISGLNQDDIESMNVLKGPAATALYGSRGQNGVILITTKSGESRNGIGVEFNANNSFSQAYGVYGDRQTTYGQGTRGNAPRNQQEAIDTGRQSWGPKMNGQEAVYFDGKTHNMTSAYDPMDYFETGYSLNNSIALTGGNDKVQTRFSFSDERIKGVVPNEEIKRNSLNLRSTASLTDRFRVDAKLNYSTQRGTNRMKGSQDPANARKSLGIIPASMPVDLMKANAHLPISNDSYTPNLYWLAENMENNDERHRLVGYISASYDITDWLTVTYRSGGDGYVLKNRDLAPLGTPWNSPGELEENSQTVIEMNHDLLFVYNKDFGADWNISGTFGGNLRTNHMDKVGYVARAFNSDDFYHWTNAQTVENRREVMNRETQSVFGSADIGYKNMAFLTVTGRNDWSSTLPSANNSYFYPSVSSSFVFSEAFELPSWISFGKARASWAMVGNDTDPYQLALLYNYWGAGFPSGGFRPPLGGIEHDVMPNADLRSETTYSYEFGFDMNFLNNRVGFDIAYYNQLTTDQLLPVQISETTGYKYQMVNAGSVRNQGIELMIYGTPVQTENFSWDVNFNFNKNVNTVEELIDGVDQLVIGDFGSVQVQARPGEQYGAIVGYDYAKDENGNIMLNEEGLPMQAAEQSVLGHVVPNFTAGLSNNFRYKNWNLGFLIDMKHGGSIYSSTNAMMYSSGTHINTLPGRDQYYSAPEGDKANLIDPQDWYGQIGSNIQSEFVYDASYIRMRELSVGYNFNMENINAIQSLKVSFVMGNPFFIWRAAPNIDPTQLLSAGNDGLGYEMGGSPAIRTYGFNLNLRL